MKALVTYVSETGNTKKIADAIFEEIQCEKEIKGIGEVDSTEGFDLLFVGFPIQGFGPANLARQFMEKNVAGKKVALFITHASPEDSTDLQGWIEGCKDAAVGADIVGLFNCQGELAEGIMEFLQASEDPKLKSFGEMGPATKGQPDNTKINLARLFAKKMIG